ncbi:hypothetical protein [Streptomyces reniochalinae]|uniref:Uncharacterized protein n=1 Tax=Streptomyces reniochalinae TaxID=2250578 RepID=A0A367EVW9_9ACTN|nr:hypothetical protein [Streptomyces reniochalinae]RCG21725.1 hypothetical protein DQ392_08420 [Streptomyces reniochalinae]
MANVIDPETHADLIELQLAVFAADRELSAYTGDDAEPLREAMRQAAAKKNQALEDSGLVGEHGWYTAEQDLKRAARAAEAG